MTALRMVFIALRLRWFLFNLRIKTWFWQSLIEYTEQWIAWLNKTIPANIGVVSSGFIANNKDKQ